MAMTLEKIQPNNQNENEVVDIIIIGAGPVGLSASLLLSRYRIHHLIIEQRLEPTGHPQAHFISCRSMEIFRELNLDQTIRRMSAPLDEWRRYIYCTNMVDLPSTIEADDSQSGSLLGSTDHFPTGPDRRISPTWECNLPQNDLEHLLQDAVVQSPFSRLLVGRRASVTELHDSVAVTLTDDRTGQREVIKCRYVVCADGAHSDTRTQLNIHRKKKTNVLQHLINVHFYSQELSKIIRRTVPGMLYFVYTPQAFGVIVNHSLKRGEFVLQLPYFPPHQRVEDYTDEKCSDILHRLVGHPIAVDIRTIRPWRLSAWNAERYRSSGGRCFIAGDAAHQMLPSGGFGMNSGIADTHNLMWKLALVLKFENDGRPEAVSALLDSYEKERRYAAEQCIATSIDNYHLTTAVPEAIGLEPMAAKLVGLAVGWTPVPGFLRRKIFDTAFRIGLAQVKLLGKDNIVSTIRRQDLKKLFSDRRKILAMRFPQLDLGSGYAEGFLDETNATGHAINMMDEFRPNIAVGQRLPHFWLRKSGEKFAEKISSLDLPALLGEKTGRPSHVLLIFKMTNDSVDAFEKQLQNRFFPLRKIYLSDDKGRSEDGIFTLAEDFPSFLPPKFVAIVRPDAHVAVFETG